LFYPSVILYLGAAAGAMKGFKVGLWGENVDRTAFCSGLTSGT
jgi:hypothetical protein